MWDKLAGTQRTVKNANEMRALAEEVAATLKPGDVLLLSGPLGGGKTVFVQSLAKALGAVDQITSPTFTVVAEYIVKDRPGVERVIHIDLYRLSEEEVSKEMSVIEVLDKEKRKNAVTVIEWGEKLGDKIPRGSKIIDFEYGASEEERKVKFT